MQHARQAEEERLERDEQEAGQSCQEAEQIDGDPEGDEQSRQCDENHEGSSRLEQVDGLMAVVAQEAFDALAHVADLRGGVRGVFGIAPEIAGHAEPHGGDAGVIALEGAGEVAWLRAT